NFGGNFALFPVATADFFGAKHLGANYGWVFLAYGVAGIAGPQVAGYFKDAAGHGDVSAWLAPFVIAGAACLAAAALVLLVLAPLTAVAGLAAALLAAGLLRLFLLRRLGGTTGDTMGAGVELAEAAALVAVALVA
ncbi:MAG: adenosylcobinamide-GDP ribazoletransferase, partial [Thiohalospira sp.]